MRAIRARSLLLSSVILLGASPRLQSQGVVSEKECEKAAKIVAKGHPEKKERGAFALLSGCGSVARRLRRPSSDSSRQSAIPVSIREPGRR